MSWPMKKPAAACGQVRPASTSAQAMEVMRPPWLKEGLL
jgi:hypothetical protein